MPFSTPRFWLAGGEEGEVAPSAHFGSFRAAGVQPWRALRALMWILVAVLYVVFIHGCLAKTTGTKHLAQALQHDLALLVATLERRDSIACPKYESYEGECTPAPL